MQVAGVEHGDAAGEVQELVALDVPDLGVLRTGDEDRVGLADATGDGGAATVHQGIIGVAHCSPRWPLIVAAGYGKDADRIPGSIR